MKKVKTIDRVRSYMRDRFDLNWFGQKPIEIRQCNKALYEAFPETAQNTLRSFKNTVLKQLIGKPMTEAELDAFFKEVPFPEGLEMDRFTESIKMTGAEASGKVIYQYSFEVDRPVWDDAKMAAKANGESLPEVLRAYLKQYSINRSNKKVDINPTKT